MPITRSAKKAHRQSLKRQSENNAVKRTMKETIKSYKNTLEQDPAQAKEMLPQVYKTIDKAAKKGVIQDNTADRKKSHIAKMLPQK